MLQTLMKLPLAISKCAVVMISQIIFAKYKEYSADKKAAMAIKDPVILKAMEDVCMKTYEKYEHDQKLDPKERGLWQRFILDEMLTPDSCHPNYLWRSQIFADAAKNLEQGSHTTTERLSDE
jgi:hypothetical protein